MVVGTIIGASIFVQPSEVTGRIGSISGVLAVWAVAGLLTLIGALVCAELSSRFTESGGVYVYLREAFGRPAGFLWGWAMFWSVHTAIIAIIAVYFAQYTDYFFELGERGQKVIALAAIWALSLVNCYGVAHGSVLQTLFTAGKLLAIAAIIVAGFALGSNLEAHFVSNVEAGAENEGGTVTAFLTALIAGLFAFGGWHMVTYNAGETVAPQRTIPVALVLGVIIVTITYVAVNVVYLYILPLEAVAASERVAADAADAVLGKGGGATMSVLVMFSTFGALSGIVLAGPRVYLAMARDGLLPRWFGRIHPTWRTPTRAIIAQAAWASVLLSTGTVRVLFIRVIYTEWLFFALMAVGLVVLRRRIGPPPWRMWGYPVLPFIFVASSLAIVINRLIAKPLESGLSLGFVALGLPVYLVWTRFARKT
jgi:APA family basic amino acid/polyamine antiporter